jgi:hypothetical protein
MQGAARWRAIIGFSAVIIALTLTAGAGCDKPLQDMSPVPDGTYGQVHQAACPINSPDCVNGAVIDTCTPCADTCVSDSCYTRTCLCTGLCRTTAKVICPAPADVCHVKGTCDPSSGTCSAQPPANDGTSCDDGNKCNGGETCKSGLCTAGTPVTCAATDVCHVAGSCDPTSGTCSAQTNAANGTNCDDGNKCNGIETCQSGTCSAGTPVTCTALDRCHVAGTCAPATGMCSMPVAAEGTSCDDGNKCNGIETCHTGVCSPGTAVTCTVQDRCHAKGTCAPATGTCSNPALNDGTSCDDGNKCNGIETCHGGVCGAGSAVTCSALDSCHKVGTCDPATGSCSQPAAADGIACGTDNKCSSSAACKTGVCTPGAPVGCPAQDKCHGPGTCDPVSGACSNPALADGTDCDDGDKCDGPDVCKSGVCTSGPAVVCVPPDACQTATCIRATGVCAYASTGNCSDAGTGLPDAAAISDAAIDQATPDDADAPLSIPDDAMNDSASGDAVRGSGGAAGHVDAAGRDSGTRAGAVIGPCSYGDGGGSGSASSRAPMVLWAVLALALRRRRRG